MKAHKLKGNYIRSRTQWIEEGEKPTRYFCNLESRNFINKQFSKLDIENGQIIESQEEILNKTKLFYENQYQKETLEIYNLAEKLKLTKSKTNRSRITVKHG